MLVRRKKICLISFGIMSVFLMAGLCLLRMRLAVSDGNVKQSCYFTLPPDPGQEDPLLYLNDDFTVQEGFHSNLPIIILSMDGELPEYKSFSVGEERVTGEEPYIRGSVRIIDGDGEFNYITDNPVMESRLHIKKRGHTSFTFDKEQYLLKLETADGMANKVDVLGMGEHDSWILNGSMADKSMIRNYLA